jgi:outer membrane protein OmpA-like peptidoglycan-associated protein
MMGAPLTPTPILPHRGERSRRIPSPRAGVGRSSGPAAAILASLCAAALAAPALAQAPSRAGAAVNWQALDQPAPPGVSVDWGALNGGAAPPAPGGAAPDVTQPVVLTPPAVVLKPPPVPKREVAVVPPPKPPQKPAPPAAPAIALPVAAPAIVAPPRVAAPSGTPQQPIPAATPALVPGKPAMVVFAKGETELPPEAHATLDRLAAELNANATLRLMIDAHASGDPGDPVLARRVSLERAVGLRSYLIDKGVPGGRMDVRALGDTAGGTGPIDRVDLTVVAP